VHHHRLAALPGISHHGGSADIARTLKHIQFNQRINPQARVKPFQEVFVRITHVLHMAKPVVDQASALIVHRRTHAAAVAVADHDDVLHTQHIDRVLDHAQCIEVGVNQDVRHIAMHEELAWQQVDQVIGWHPAV